MNYRLVIFDFDGTLADTFPWFVRNVNTMADRFGFRHVRDDEVESLRHHDVRHFMRHLGISVWKAPMIAARMREQQGRDIASISMFKGFRHALHTLAAGGATMGIVTSNSTQNVRHVLGNHCSLLINHYECGVSLFGKEPRLRRIMKRSGIHARDTIYVGDEIRDLQAARAVRVAFGAVSWGFTHIDTLKSHSPTHAFSDITDLVEKLGNAHHAP